MASGLLALFDDVATLFDDMATMSKVATQKTAGVLGDDLAVAAEQASGYAASRELPVLWRIAKGSFVNKLIILPVAFVLSYVAPFLIDYILILGAFYLAFEGAEKIIEWIIPHGAHDEEAATHAVASLASEEELRALEDARVKSAIKTDFVLSIEIVIIALSAVANETLLVKVLVTAFVAILATVGVYGLVALLVRLDDMGYALARKSDHGIGEKLGMAMVKALPKLIRMIGVVGTVALLTVAGGILMHHFHILEHYLHALPSLLAEMLVGLVAGLIVFAPVALYHRLRAA